MRLKDNLAAQERIESVLLAHYSRLVDDAYMTVMLRELGKHEITQVASALKAHIADTTIDHLGRVTGRYPPAYADLLFHMERAETVTRRDQHQATVQARYLESDAAASKVMLDIGWRDIIARAHGRNERVIRHLKHALHLDLLRPDHSAALTAAFKSWAHPHGEPDLEALARVAREYLQQNAERR